MGISCLPSVKSLMMVALISSCIADLDLQQEKTTKICKAEGGQKP